MDLRDQTTETFRGLLADPSGQIRARTAQQLRWLGPDAVALLRVAIRDAVRQVRHCGIRALGKIGTADAVAVLAESFEPHDEAHLFHVLRAIGFATTAVDRAVGHIEVGLRCAAPTIQLQALLALRGVERPPVRLFGRVVELSKVADERLRDAALEALAVFGDRALPILLEATSDDSFSRLPACRSLRELVVKDCATTESLLEHFRDDPETFFTTLGTDLDRERLDVWLSGQDPEVRVLAAEALSDQIRFHCQDPGEAAAAARQLLENPDPQVKQEAAAALDKLSALDPPMAAPLLLKLAREAPELIYDRSLVRVIDAVPEVLEECGRFLVQWDAVRRDELLVHLMWAQHERETPLSHAPILDWLAAVVGEVSGSWERFCLTELLESCGQRAIPALEALLEVAREDDQCWRICRAIGRLGGATPRLVPLLRDLLLGRDASEVAGELLIRMDLSTVRNDLLAEVEAALLPGKIVPDGVFAVFARWSPERLDRWLESGDRSEPSVELGIALIDGLAEELELHRLKERGKQALHALARYRPDLAARPRFLEDLVRRARTAEDTDTEEVRALGWLLPDTLPVFEKLLAEREDPRHKDSICQVLLDAVERQGQEAPAGLMDLALQALDLPRGRFPVENALKVCPRLLERLVHVLGAASPAMVKQAALLIRVAYVERRLKEKDRQAALEQMLRLARDSTSAHVARLEAIKGCARLASGVIDHRKPPRRAPWHRTA